MSPAVISKGPDAFLVKQPDMSNKEPTFTWNGGWEYTGATKNCSFDCEYPTADANFRRILDPLPFPKELHDVIAWAGAYLDRAAHMAADKAKAANAEIGRLQSEVNSYMILSEKQLKQIHELEETQEKNKATIANHERRFKVVEAANMSLKKEMQAQDERHKKEIEEWVTHHDSENAEFDKQLKKEIALKLAAHSKLQIAETEIRAKEANIKSLKAEVTSLKQTIVQQVTVIRKNETDLKAAEKLKEDYENKQKQALETTQKLEKELADTKAKASESDKNYTQSQIKIAYLESKISELIVAKNSLNTELESLKKEFQGISCELALAKGNLETTKKKITYWKTKCDDLEKEWKEKSGDNHNAHEIARLNHEKSDLQRQLADAKRTIKYLEELAAEEDHSCQASNVTNKM